MDLIIYIDGASRPNPGPSALGIVVCNLNEEVIQEKGSLLGTMTNNQAEYQALLEALSTARALGARAVEIKSDSQLLVRQFNGEYQVKEEKLKVLLTKAKGLSGAFQGGVKVVHIPREENERADALAGQALLPAGRRDAGLHAATRPSERAARKPGSPAALPSSDRSVPPLAAPPAAALPAAGSSRSSRSLTPPARRLEASKPSETPEPPDLRAPPMEEPGEWGGIIRLPLPSPYLTRLPEAVAEMLKIGFPSPEAVEWGEEVASLLDGIIGVVTDEDSYLEVKIPKKFRGEVEVKTRRISLTMEGRS